MKALTICFILFSMAAVGQSIEKVYTWTDAEGVTHYSRDAPEGTEATNPGIVGDDSQTEPAESNP
jgi:hypothetical protein